MNRLYRMDCLNAIKLLAILTFVHGVSGQTVDVSGPSEAANGTSASLTCALNGGSAARIDWVEVLESGTSTIFNGEDIFSINPKYSNFKVTSYSTTGSVMTIENADVFDDGAYRCVIPSDETATPVTVVVEANSTKTLTLTSIVTNNEDMYVATCDAAGGKPQETITWILDGVTQTDGNGNTIVDTNPPATAPLSNSKSVFTFPATPVNYGQTLFCEVSGHDVLTQLNGEESIDLDIHASPSSDTTVTAAYVTKETGITVSCSAQISPQNPPSPAMRNYYIFSNGTLLHESMEEGNAVTVSAPIEGTEYTCMAGNYLGNTTLSKAVTYDPSRTTTPPPTTAQEKTTPVVKDTTPGGGDGANVAAIAGGVVGAIVVIVIIVIAVCYCKKEERFCFEAGGTKSSGSSKPAGSAVGSSNGSEREKTKPEAAPRGHGSIQHTNDNPNQDMYAMVDKKPSGGRGGDAPDRGSGPGQNEPQGMLYADLDLSHKAGHTDKHVPKNENDVVVYSSILV